MPLRDLGFSAAAEAVYRALLDHPGTDPAPLADGPLAPVLAELLELGVVRPDPERPSGVAPLNPALALAELIERVEAELIRRHRRAGDTRLELAELAGRFRRAGGQVQAADGLSEVDRRVLELLASGITDEAAARVVGFSVRQLRRRVAVLMARLEAASRFEAGVAAARRGWVRAAGS
ncbi:hypothetical protein M8C13_19995 [Crossiella sp. SN42]|uniref:hypothetical protein n=1 Tax=Crossiella sp. SN42 TaxID=2944808 RepID=UPI00207D12D4|nr:hypothetical protein [Crossiella sp. SN42]MCO1578038.1 hypothetical protein [Crossiella sp. SN42]